MPPKAKQHVKTDLAKLASHNYVSERGLVSVLAAIKDNPEMTETCSRSTVKRARDDAVDISTLHGNLLRRMWIPTDSHDATEGLEFSYIHPIAMLVHAVTKCDAFKDIFVSAHESNPSDLSNLWDVCLYTDEITMGDPLSVHKQSRKAQGVYWSIKQLGPEVLACDDAWMVLTVLSSDAVKHIGGLTVLTNYLMNLFFEQGSDIRTGVKLLDQFLFMNVNIVIQDYDAFRNMMQSKGASGLLVCILCQNCVTHKRRDLHDAMVASDDVDIRKFRRQTYQSIADSSTCSFLNVNTPFMYTVLKVYINLIPTARKDAYAKLRNARTVGELKELQTELGFNLAERGVLMHPIVGRRMLEAIMYDWMHIYVVSLTERFTYTFLFHALTYT